MEKYTENPPKEFYVFAQVYMYLCVSVLLLKSMGASLFLKHRDSVVSQPQKDWLPDQVFKQMIKYRRTRQIIGQDRDERWGS